MGFVEFRSTFNRAFRGTDRSVFKDSRYIFSCIFFFHHSRYRVWVTDGSRNNLLCFLRWTFSFFLSFFFLVLFWSILFVLFSSREKTLPKQTLSLGSSQGMSPSSSATMSATIFGAVGAANEQALNQIQTQTPRETGKPFGIAAVLLQGAQGKFKM